MQQELRMMSVLEQDVIELPREWIQACPTPQSAMRLCILNHRSKASFEHVADTLKIKPGNFSRIINSDRNGENRYLGADKIAALQAECGNCAVTQWIDMKSRGLIKD